MARSNPGAGMRRRDILGVLGGAAVAWPLMAQERMRRIAVMMPLAEDNPEARTRIAAFVQELQQLGWVVGRNLQIEFRWGVGDTDLSSKVAAELVASAPDVILVTASPATSALQLATRTVPIVFTMVADPVSAGFVSSLARPNGNITGFTNIEYAIGAKWLELLKEIAPHVMRVGVIEILPYPLVLASSALFSPWVHRLGWS